MSASGDDLLSLRGKTILVTGVHAVLATPFHSVLHGQAPRSSQIITGTNRLPKT
jgi:hypothetical protein